MKFDKKKIQLNFPETFLDFPNREFPLKTSIILSRASDRTQFIIMKFFKCVSSCLKINLNVWSRNRRELFSLWSELNFTLSCSRHNQTNSRKMIFIYFILALLLVLYVYMTWNFDYWSKKGVPSAKATIVLGNLPQTLLRRKHVTADFDKIYE